MHESFSVNGPSMEIRAYGPGDFRRHGRSVQDRELAPQFTTKLAAILWGMNVHTLYAPYIDVSSAVIGTPEQFKEQTALPGGIILLRTKNRTLGVDGVLLEQPGEAVIMETNDPIIIASAGPDVPAIVAHAGRDSLIDRGAVVQGLSPLRQQNLSSIVDCIYEKYAAMEAARTVTMSMLLSTPWLRHPLDKFAQDLHLYVHERWPSAVRLKKRAVWLDLAKIFESQAKKKSRVMANHLFPVTVYKNLARGGTDRKNVVIVHVKPKSVLLPPQLRR